MPFAGKRAYLRTTTSNIDANLRVTNNGGYHEEYHALSR